MIVETKYAVVRPYPDDITADVYQQREDAIAHADRDGGQVYRMEPLTESALWDWGVAHDGREPLVYVNESAARSSIGSTGRLVRRRAGTKQWQAVTP